MERRTNMHPDHLTTEELIAYVQRALVPDRLLDASDHLAECSECRERVAQENADSSEPVRLSYEELVEYLDETIDPVRRHELSEKLQRSAASRAELSDLTGFRDRMKALPPNEFGATQSSRDRILIFPRAAMVRWALPLAAAIAITGGAIWWATYDKGTTGVVTLRDGDRAILLKSNGRLRGLPGVPHDLVPLIATAMREGKVQIPAEIRSLAGEREILAGAPNESSEFQAKKPIATAVRERMPHFRWSEQPNATHYRVRVVDSQSGEVVMTGESDKRRTEWTPAEPLEAGKIYQWQVDALRDNEVIARSPKPPEPEARFKILSDNERLKVVSIGMSTDGSHLAMAVADVQAGLLDEATEQLRTLAKENPESKIPVDLLAQIKDARRGKGSR